MIPDNTTEVWQILVERINQSTAVDSKSELESSLSDFKDSAGNESKEMEIYNAAANSAWCDRQSNQPTNFTGTTETKLNHKMYYPKNKWLPW